MSPKTHSQASNRAVYPHGDGPPTLEGHLLVQSCEYGLKYGHLLFVAIRPKPVAQFFQRHISRQGSRVVLSRLPFCGAECGCQDSGNFRKMRSEGICR